MTELHLLIYKTGIEFALKKSKKILKNEKILLEDNSDEVKLYNLVDLVLKNETFDEIHSYWAKPIFGMCPNTVTNHDIGVALIALNSSYQKDQQELMLNVNNKHKLQFYFGFDIDIYRLLKAKDIEAQFSFSGEKFLQELKLIISKNSQIHINLYENQVEFWVFENNKVLLYNLLDDSTEVDFLYFILFSISKLNIDLQKAQIFLYGDVACHESFVSEIKKYVKNCKIVQQNQMLKRHILLHNV